MASCAGAVGEPALFQPRGRTSISLGLISLRFGSWYENKKEMHPGGGRVNPLPFKPATFILNVAKCEVKLHTQRDCCSCKLIYNFLLNNNDSEQVGGEVPAHPVNSLCSACQECNPSCIWELWVGWCLSGTNQLRLWKCFALSFFSFSLSPTVKFSCCSKT